MKPRRALEIYITTMMVEGAQNKLRTNLELSKSQRRGEGGHAGSPTLYPSPLKYSHNMRIWTFML